MQYSASLMFDLLCLLSVTLMFIIGYSRCVFSFILYRSIINFWSCRYLTSGTEWKYYSVEYRRRKSRKTYLSCKLRQNNFNVNSTYFCKRSYFYFFTRFINFSNQHSSLIIYLWFECPETEINVELSSV